MKVSNSGFDLILELICADFCNLITAKFNLVFYIA